MTNSEICSWWNLIRDKTRTERNGIPKSTTLKSPKLNWRFSLAPALFPRMAKHRMTAATNLVGQEVESRLTQDLGPGCQPVGAVARVELVLRRRKQTSYSIKYFCSYCFPLSLRLPDGAARIFFSVQFFYHRLLGRRVSNPSQSIELQQTGNFEGRSPY